MMAAIEKRLIILLFVLLCIASQHSTAAGSMELDEAVRTTTAATHSNENQHSSLRGLVMVGAYSPVSSTSDEYSQILLAAQFAIENLEQTDRLYKFLPAVLSATSHPFQVVRAYQQVVAGMNYQLIIMLEDPGTKECLGAFGVTVYNHFGDLTVTKWAKEVRCCSATKALKDPTIELNVDNDSDT